MFPSWNARACGLVMSADDAITIASESGFPGVDLMVRDLVEEGNDVSRLARRMADLGLRGGAWPLPVQWRGELERFRADLKELPRYAEAAARLGLTRTGTWVLPDMGRTGLRRDRSAGRMKDHGFEFHVCRLDPISHVLNQFGCKLGLEIMGPAAAREKGWEPFITSYADLMALLFDLQRTNPNVGLLVDAFHLFAAGEKYPPRVTWGLDSVVWVHLAEALIPDRAQLQDVQRDLPGTTGFGECREILADLKQRGFDGPVTAEPLGQCASLKGMSPDAVALRIRRSLEAIWPGEESPFTQSKK